MGRIPFPPPQKPKSMQKAVMTPEQVPIEVGQLRVGDPFMTLEGKMGKVLEYLSDSKLVKVLVYEIGKDMGIEILWPLNMPVLTTPKQVPVPSPLPADPDPMPAPEPTESELVSTTRIYLQDVPVGARCKIMHGNTPVEVKVKKVTPPTETVNYVTVEIEIDGKLWTRAGMTEVLGIYGKEDTAIAVDNAAKAKEAGRAKAAVKATPANKADIATDEERFAIMTPWGPASAVRMSNLPLDEPKQEPVASITEALIKRIDGHFGALYASREAYVKLDEKLLDRWQTAMSQHAQACIAWDEAMAKYKDAIGEPTQEPQSPVDASSIQKHDPVNSPSHYTDGKIETIDFIEQMGLGFHLGNAVKYLTRAGKKGDALEDLKKARWYIQRCIDTNSFRQSTIASKLSSTEERVRHVEKYVMTHKLSAMQSKAIQYASVAMLSKALETISRHIALVENNEI